MASGSGLPNQTLERFAQAARDETDLEALTAELVSVVQTTMQPAEVGGAAIYPSSSGIDSGMSDIRHLLSYLSMSRPEYTALS